MKKKMQIELVPDEKRENLDFLGHIMCPLKDLFSTRMNAFIEAYNGVHEPKINGVIPMGSCGTDIYFDITSIQDTLKFPSVLTESGYGEFFEPGIAQGYQAKGVFEYVSPSETNPGFDTLKLGDPGRMFNIFGAMPYVMLVNTKKLGSSPVPQRISDLMEPCYKGKIVTGHTGEDINELILLELYKNYGEAGVRAFARNFAEPMKTIDMVHAAVRGANDYAVYILPYFFAKAAPKHDFLRLVWPEDGALFCPMYVIVKKERNKDFDVLLDFLFGDEFGQAMADMHFPHVHPRVDNKLPGSGKFQWVGWDYLYEMNVFHRVKEIEKIFYDERPDIMRMPAAASMV